MLPARHPDASVARGHGRRAEWAPFHSTSEAPGGGAERVAGAILGRYLRGVAARSVVTYTDMGGQRLDAESAGDVIADLVASPTPLVVTYWIADALAVAMLPFVNEAFGELLRYVTCVVDDTFAGRAAGCFIDGIGGHATLVALPGNPERLRQVHALMRRRSSYAFPVDGGGPYREVGTGIIALATTLRATLVPIAAVARPALPPVHSSRVRLPMPRTRLSVGIGTPIQIAAERDRRVEAAHLRDALDRLHDVALTRSR